jgi:hypothetical protein
MASNYKTLQEFPREFHLAWEVAANGNLNLAFPTRGKATNFKARMYQYRKRLREQDLAAAALFDGIDLQVIPNDEGAIVTNLQIDWKRQLLAQAETSLKQPEKTAEAPPLYKPTTSEDCLKDMGYTSEKQ